MSVIGSFAQLLMMKPARKNEMDIEPKLWKKYDAERTSVLRSLMALSGTMQSFFFLESQKMKATSAMAAITSSVFESEEPNGT